MTLSMDTTPSDPLRLVVFARPDDEDALVKVLMDVLHLNRLDARIHAHAVPGVLVDRLSLSQAQQAVRGIRELGVNAIAVPESALPKLEHPEVVHRAACRDTGFEVSGLSGAERLSIAWSDLEVISLGWVPLDKARHFNVESQVVVFSAPHSVEEKVEVTSLYGAELWMTILGSERVLKLDQDHMNYEYLGKRMADSAVANFRLFLADLVQRARSAYLTPATHAFLRHAHLEQYRFDDSAALKRETLRHVLLHREQLKAAAKQA